MHRRMSTAGMSFRNKGSLSRYQRRRHTNALTAVDEDFRHTDLDVPDLAAQDDDQDSDSQTLSSDSRMPSKDRAEGSRGYISRTSSRSSMSSSVFGGSSLFSVVRDPADELYPFRPLCGKCSPIKILDTLPLKPDQLHVWKSRITPAATGGMVTPNLGHPKSIMSRSASRAASPMPSKSGMGFGALSSAEESDNQGTEKGTEKGPKLLPPGYYPGTLGTQRFSRSPIPSARSSVTAHRHSSRMPMLQQQRELKEFAEIMTLKPEYAGPRKWTSKVESLAITTEAPKSCFSDEHYDGPNPAAVLRRLTKWQVAIIECWAMNHVRRHFLEVCAKAYDAKPREGHKHREAIQSATICQLVRRSQKDDGLNEEEFEFMLARLKHYPLLREFPPEVLRENYKELEVREMVRGGTIFDAQEPIDGLFILVQGEVELIKSGESWELDSGITVKEATCVLSQTDLIMPHVSKPFLLRPEDQRYWSCTGVVRDDEDSASMAMCLFVPMALIIKVAKAARKKESKELVELIVRVFAPAVRINERICAKYSEIFELEDHLRSHAILQQGSRPPLCGKPEQVAKLCIVIEGNVQIVRLQPGRGKKAIKETVGPGRLLGESAIYGETYPHYAVCISDIVKVLSVTVEDYLQKLLSRSTTLERAERLTDKGQQPDADGAIDEADRARSIAEISRKNAAILESSHCASRIQRDATKVKAKYWKMVPDKSMLAWRPPPACRPHKAVAASAHTSETLSRADLIYPREFDLFPSVQRSVMKSISTDGAGGATCSTAFQSGQLASATGTMSRMQSTTFALSGTASVLASLDDKIRREAAQAEELESEHYLHAALGIYLEDAERPPSAAVHMLARRSPQPLAASPPLISPPSRPAVLMTCGAVSGTSIAPHKISVPTVSVSTTAATQ